MKYKDVYTLELLAIGLYLVSFSVTRIVGQAFVRFHNATELLFLLSIILAGAATGYLCSSTVSNKMYALLVFAATSVIACLILFYLPYILPYAGKEHLYQQLGLPLLKIYIMILNYLPLLMGMTLLFFVSTRGK